MDTLLTLRRPIRDVKPRKSKLIKKSSAPPPTHTSLRKKRKPVESAAAPPAVEFGSFVALYRAACGAGAPAGPGYHHLPYAEPLRAPGSLALLIPPIPPLGAGDARRPLARVVMETDY